MKFSKNPAVSEAVQLTWKNWSVICDFVPEPWFVRGVWLDEDGEPLPDGSYRFADGNGNLGLILRNREGQTSLVTGGDWIARDINGEFYAWEAEAERQ